MDKPVGGWPGRNRLERRRAKRADRLAQRHGHDNFAASRTMLRAIADKAGEWAGIPMPVEGSNLIVEPSFPAAAVLSPPEKHAAEDSDARIRNLFWSWSKRSQVMIYEKDGRIDWGIIPGVHHATQLLQTVGASYAWGLEQEQNALALLRGLVPPHIFKQYMLTGMFLETSPRSNLTYLFRKLRPTLAISMRTEKLRLIAALCLHPIAYYEGSWAGAMCPTDDVIAHLMLMRGDEAMFWRRANQHPPWRAEAGI